MWSRNDAGPSSFGAARATADLRGTTLLERAFARVYMRSSFQ